MSRPAVTSGALPPVHARPAGLVVSRLWPHRAVAIRLAAAVALFLILWSCTPPAEPRFRLCVFHWLSGRECPFCGMTRAVFALAKGNFRQALGFNRLSPLGFAMLFSLFWNSSTRGRLWTVGIAAFAVYGVLRIFFVGA